MRNAVIRIIANLFTVTVKNPNIESSPRNAVTISLLYGTEDTYWIEGNTTATDVSIL